MLFEGGTHGQLLGDIFMSDTGTGSKRAFPEVRMYCLDSMVCVLFCFLPTYSEATISEEAAIILR